MTPRGPVQRWNDSQRSIDERRAALYFRHAGEPGLSPAALERVRMRLAARGQAAASGGRRLAQAALVAAALLGSLPAAVALVRPDLGLRMVRWVDQWRTPSPRSARPSPLAASPPRATPSPPRAAPAPTPAPARPPAPRHPPRPPIGTSPAKALQDDSAESDQLELILAGLRPGGDPAGALAEVRTYRQRFPEGAFAREVSLAELQADLALHRDPEALAVLDRFEAAGYTQLPRPDELRLARAELLSKLGRCGEAEPVLGRSAALAGDLRGRALYAEAGCAAREGRQSRARELLETYLAESPWGPLAEEARQALATAASTRP